MINELTIELAKVLQPLKRLSNPQDAIRFLAEIGLELPGLDFSDQSLREALNKISTGVGLIQKIVSDIQNKKANPDAVIHLLKQIEEIQNAVELLHKKIEVLAAGMNSAVLTTALAGFGRRLLDNVLVTYLRAYHRKIFSTLMLVGVIIIKRTQGKLVVEVRWEDLSLLFSDPLLISKRSYNWEEDFAADRFLSNIQLFTKSFGLLGGPYHLSDGLATAMEIQIPDDPLLDDLMAEAKAKYEQDVSLGHENSPREEGGDGEEYLDEEYHSPSVEDEPVIPDEPEEEVDVESLWNQIVALPPANVPGLDEDYSAFYESGKKELRFALLREGVFPDAGIEVGINFSEAPRKQVGEDVFKKGFAVGPYILGSFSGEMPLSEKWQLKLSASAQLDKTIAVIFRPQKEPLFYAGAGGATGGSSSNVNLELHPKTPQSTATDGAKQELIIFGEAEKTRLSAKEFSVKINLQASSVPEFLAEFNLVGGKFVISPASFDGFVKNILPADGIETGIDLTVGFSSIKGMYFAGSAGLEKSIDVNLNILDVLKIDTLNLSIQTGAAGLSAEISTSAQVKIGPVLADINRFGLMAKLALRKDANDKVIGPGFNLGFKPPSGIGLLVDAGPVTGAGALYFNHEKGQYSGALMLDFNGVGLTAIGLLDTKLPDGSDGYSFLILIAAKFAPIQLGFGFTLNGVGGLAGIHRSVSSEALQQAVLSGSLSDILFPEFTPENSPTDVISRLANIFPVTENKYVFGPIAKLAWGTPSIIEGKLGLIFELPSLDRIFLLGQLSAILPSKENPIVSLNIDILGELNLAEKFLKIIASLHHSTIAGFPVYGDIAIFLSWGEVPNFIFTVGGFHPQFPAPSMLPALRRFTLCLSTSDNPRLIFQTYFALTSNSLQFGALGQMYYKEGSFEVKGEIGFNALIIFKPFSLMADISAYMAVFYEGTSLLTIQLQAAITGPQPWHVWGRASISILFIDASVQFDKTFGELPPPDHTQAPDVLLALSNELSKIENWSSTLPPNVSALVAIADSKEQNILLVHPLGGLILREKTVPLNRQLKKFGNIRLATPVIAIITKVRLGTLELVEGGWKDTFDHFAPGQYMDLSDAEKISSPSFERMKSGCDLLSDTFSIGANLDTTITYYTLPDSAAGIVASDTKIAVDDFKWMNKNRANARSQVKNTGSQKFTENSKRINRMDLKETEFVIATTNDLTFRNDLTPKGMARAEARRILDAHLEAHEGDRSLLQIVPSHEVEGVPL